MLEIFEKINNEANKFLPANTDINLVASFIAFMYTIHTKHDIPLDYKKYYYDFEFENHNNHFKTIENDTTIITALLIDKVISD